MKPIPLPPNSGESGKIWRVGTLAYTTTGLVILFCWLLWGDFAWQMRDRGIPPLMQLLLKKFDASDTFAGVIFGAIPPALGMILGPIISYRSDRHRGSWGRRIPFLLAPTPIMVVAILGLACSPALGTYLNKVLGSHSPGLNMLVLLFFAIFWIIFELAFVVINSIYGALINDVVPPALLGRFYGLFRAVSLIAGIIYNYLIFGKAETLYFWIFTGLAVFFGAGFTLMCLNIKEGEYPPQDSAEEGLNFTKIIEATKTYCRECFGKSYYRLYFVAIITAEMYGVPFNLFSYFYAQSVGVSPGSYGEDLAITYTISLILAYPLGWLADRFHPLRLWIVMTFIHSFVFLVSYYFVRDAWTFSIVLVVNGVVSGTSGTASASIAQRLLPKAEFAQFFSASRCISNLAWMVVSPTVGIILDHTNHDYRNTFLMCSCLAMAGFVGLLFLHSKFMAHGGPRNYVAPE